MRVGIAILSLALTGCLGIGEDPEENQFLEYYGLCREYVACISVVKPQQAESLGQVYDPQGGLCWSAPDVQRKESCRNACERGLEELSLLHPNVAECQYIPVGDTDSPPDFLPTAGAWTLTQTDVVMDTCGVELGNLGTYGVEVSAGDTERTFSFVIPSISPSEIHQCTLSGANFTCLPIESAVEATIRFGGTLSSATQAQGTWEWSYSGAGGDSCQADLPFTAQWD